MIPDSTNKKSANLSATSNSERDIITTPQLSNKDTKILSEKVNNEILDISRQRSEGDSTLPRALKGALADSEWRHSYNIPFLLPLMDIIILFLCTLCAIFLQQFLRQWFPLAEPPLPWLYPILSGPVLIIILWMEGGYPGYGLRGVQRARMRSIAALYSTISTMLIDHIILHGELSRGLCLMSGSMSIIILPIGDNLLRELLVRIKCWGMPVAVVGNTDRADLVTGALLAQPHLGWRPVVVLSTIPNKMLRGLPCESIETAQMWSKKCKLAVAALAPGDLGTSARVVSDLPFDRVVLVPDLTGFQTLSIVSRDLGGILGLEVRRNLLKVQSRILKRTLDYIIGIPSFLMAIPIILFGALLVRIIDGSPSFYTQNREGLHGRRIRVWKLRTMHIDSEQRLQELLDRNPLAKSEWSEYFKLRNDPRIIPLIGKLFRVSSIDELPQLWNVMRGDLSLVGPRPFPEYHLEKFSLDFRKLRASVKPGITGLWQVGERSNGDLEVQEALDAYYIRNWSPWLDISILGRTIWALVFRRSGAS